MKHNDISYYFVLYLVAIITVFAITVERDKTLEQRNDVIANLVEVYVRPLRMSAYDDTTRYYIAPNRETTSDSVQSKIRTEGPLITNDVVFRIVEASKVLAGGDLKERSIAGEVRNENGDGVMTYPPLEVGTYVFKVSGQKNRVRIVPGGMEIPVRDTVYRIPYSKRLENVDKDTATLIVKVTKSGVEPQQLTLNVQETQENWIIGPPYTKKIFVAGIEDIGSVSFSVTPDGTIEGARGSSFATFTWNSPLPGRHSFTVSGSAARGLGGKDRASVQFEINVQPASFVSQPADHGFWGVPYTFDGQIVGLNPIDLTAEVLHDGKSVSTQPIVPKIVMTPDRNWSTLAFKVVYHKVVIKEQKVTLASPAPPQIKWLQQNLDRERGTFTVVLAAADAGGAAVTLSLQSQPQGIARLDKIKGTSFTITVDLKDKPSAVFLKVTASDQYGGQNTSSKQFNIAQ
jgi:hypothetical protein